MRFRKNQKSKQSPSFKFMCSMISFFYNHRFDSYVDIQLVDNLVVFLRDLHNSIDSIRDHRAVSRYTYE